MSRKGKLSTRRARKDILRSMGEHARARKGYDKQAYDGTASEES